MIVRRALEIALGSALVLPGLAAAQQVAAAVSPDTAHVGDVVRAAIRVELPPGYRAILPDSLPLQGEVENAGRRTLAIDSLPGGGTRVTAIYPIAAWRPGEAAIPAVPVHVEGPGGARELSVNFPPLAIRSVLPPDTAGVEPRPPKDVLGSSRTVWSLVVALLVAAALVAAGVLLYRRRRAAIPVAEPVASPRERVLAALDDARRSGLVESGEFAAFYSLCTAAVRAFLAEMDPRWSGDLTTPELIDAMAAGLDRAAVAELGRILEAADRVKFARRRPSVDEALAEWHAMRRWAESFELPAPAPAAATAPVAVETVAAGQEVA